MTDKVALVTGASRGIGRGVAVELAKSGYHVVVNYAGNDAAADETLNLIKYAGLVNELFIFSCKIRK